jgi:hypothetical protein
MMNAQRNRSMYLRVGERLAEIRKSRKIRKSCKKCMSHANECVRLAGLTDDLIVRDQLLDLAQGWMLAARRARRPSDDTRVVSLHKNLGDNVVPFPSPTTASSAHGAVDVR